MATDLVYLRSERGVVLAFGQPVPDVIAAQVRRGDLTLCRPDGSDLQVDKAAAAPPLPKRSAARQVWVDFAISQGMDRGRVAAMTRAELVDKFTRLRAVS